MSKRYFGNKLFSSARRVCVQCCANGVRITSKLFFETVFPPTVLLHWRAHAIDLQNEINVINLVIQMNACSYARTAHVSNVLFRKKPIDWCLYSSNKRNTVYCWCRTHLLRKPLHNFFFTHFRIVLHPNCLFVLSLAKWDSYAFQFNAHLWLFMAVWDGTYIYMGEQQESGFHIFPLRYGYYIT